MVKVRFAPSPTGYLHIGGARTALFNWLYAKAQGGKFVLRIEDTDQQRSQKEFEDEILESMKWLGLEFDEIYYQSKRFDIYREQAKKLLKEGKAYKEGDAIILKIPEGQEIKWYDLIRGEISFDRATIKDQVLMKSDGSPAYSFCCVVDDALMEISCVIRGEDHISNTPKQIMIYQALGFKVPKFAHLPLIMGEEGGRLSKRTGAVAVSDYRKEGFLAEALVNYLMLLGWAPGNNQEVIKLSSAVKKFSIKKVNKAAAVFSMDKLKWLNGQYIRQLKTQQLMELLAPFLQAKGYIGPEFDRAKLENIVALFKNRLTTLKEFLERADFIFEKKVTMNGEDKEQYLSVKKNKEFSLLMEKLKQVSCFEVDEVEKQFREVVQELDIKASDLVPSLRVALTGRSGGPGIFETMVVLGKDKTIQRLAEAFK